MKIFHTVFLIFSLAVAIQCETCFRNLIVVGTESNSILVAWDYTCPYRNTLFKVYVTHQQFKACQTKVKDEFRGKGIKVVEVRDVKSVELEGLHSYSKYKIVVRAFQEKVLPFEELQVLTETRSSVPNVTVERDQNSIIIAKDKIKFSWKVPSSTNCKYFNGEVSHFYYVFKPISPWAVDDQSRSGFTEETFIEFSGLSPFTSYKLTVHASFNSNFDSDLGLTMSATTLESGVVGTPTNLQLQRYGPKAHLSWIPSYPPTSEVLHYLIRWQSENTNFSDIIFFPNNTECIEDLPKLCLTISQSEESLVSSNLTFQVKAFGKDASSDWSIKYYLINSNQERSQSSLVTVVVVSAVAILFLILLIVGLTHQSRNERSKRYKNVPDYEFRRNVSFTSTFGPSSLHQTFSNHQDQRGSSPEQASMETTYTMVSKQSSNSFSLPIAAPREKLSSKLKRRVSLQSQPTMKVDTLKYQHLLLPAPVQTPQTKRLGSIQEIPLPPVPLLHPKEPIYEDICQETLLSNRIFKSNSDLEEQESSIPLRRKNGQNGFDSCQLEPQFTFRKKSLDNDEEEFLRPNQGDDDDYLKPRSLNATSTSLDDLDAEYLTPNHDRFERINTRSLSPPHCGPPLVPMQSYKPMKFT